MLLVKTRDLQKALVLGLVLGNLSVPCLSQVSFSVRRPPQISVSVRNDVSAPVRDLQTEFIPPEPPDEVPLRMPHPAQQRPILPDPVRQTVALPSVSRGLGVTVAS